MRTYLLLLEISMFRYSNIALEREIIHFIQALNQFVEMLLVKSTYFKLTLSGKK